MFTCPNCHTKMTRVHSPQGVFFGCAACRGRAATLPVLRKHVDRTFLRELWRDARAGKGHAGRPCPVCLAPMAEFPPAGGTHNLDVCAPCHLVWFDPEEYEALPAAPPPAEATEENLPPKAREALARIKIEQLEWQESRRGRSLSADPPDAGWKYGLALIGIPVEIDAPAVNRLPVLTWAIGAAMVATLIFTFNDLQYYVDEFGLIPAQAGRNGGITWLTSFFLHGGLIHLLGNLYFLVVFGDNVEDYLGKGWYVLLVILAAVTGDVMHVLFEPRNGLPIAGASGGISGIIMFYALAFPRARIGLFVWIFFLPRWINFPAVGFVVFWVVMQLIGVYMQVGGFSNVSALAHLGGAGIGLAFWVLRGR